MNFLDSLTIPEVFMLSLGIVFIAGGVCAYIHEYITRGIK